MDEPATRKVILAYYLHFKTHTLTVQSGSVERYSRRSLTEQLAALLNSL